MHLTAQGIGCRRGGRAVLSDLSFSITAGQLLLVSGANGAGKTTLLRLISGLIPDCTGSLRLDPAGDATIAEQAHYLGHRDALKPALTVMENLKFWAAFIGQGEIALPVALARVGLFALADFPAAYLSAGQRRRLALARLLAVPRPLWLLDEPTAALDDAGHELLATILRDHLAQGGLAVAASHGPIGVSPTAELRLAA
jgi:heme exporter protein A